MRSERRPVLFLTVALITLVGAMTLAVRAQRDAATDAAGRQAAITHLLTATLDVDSAVSGYLYTADTRDLGPYAAAQARAARAFVIARRVTGSSPQIQRDLDAAGDAMSRWSTLTGRRIAQVAQAGSPRQDYPSERRRKAALDDFRAAMTATVADLNAQRDRNLSRAGRIATVAIGLLVLLFGLAGSWLIRRGSRLREEAHATELRFRESQREFTDVIQAVATEGEADAVLKRHLERSVGRAVVTVFKRNNSDNRLEATTPVPATSTLTAGLRQAEPRDCVAIRMAQPHSDGTKDDGLLTCQICGKVPGMTDCRPLLVGGRVIGSVLIEHPEALSGEEERRFVESVGRAAPVLANLQTIAIAESRAATDSLTGLANRRAIGDTLKRMAAHASRAVEPLAAIAMDLDHFKQINDRYGHDVGDSVLAAVGEILRTSTREADVPGRLGGEEFIILAPGTGVEGAEILAEKLRETIYRADIPGIDESITASFGVAVLPDDAHTAELLLRRADRALYLAKDQGRNRVELARSAPE